MSSEAVIALASVITGLGATAAAVVAAYALRAQQHGLSRQHDLENLRWLSDSFNALRPMRQRAARARLDGGTDVYALREIMNFFENASYMIREGFLRERTFDNILQSAVFNWWHASEEAILGIRSRTSPSVYEHAEWAKDRVSETLATPTAEQIQDFLERESALAAPSD